ncbi:MAG: hypothetical protein OEO77_04485 [Acidimicrobiia bacterium]|nr:hypothetical protein [Acidimicrobiia bacterium]
MTATLLVVGVAPAVAGPPEAASGDWTYVPTRLAVREAGSTTFVYATEISTFTGTFPGTSDDEFVVVCHHKGPESFMLFVKGTFEFTGEVDGRAGEMTMKSRASRTPLPASPRAEQSGQARG